VVLVIHFLCFLAGTQLKRSPPAAGAAPVSSKDLVETASPAGFSANVHETMPGPQATKDPNAVTTMKSVTATENPGAKQSTGQASSKVMSSSSEFSTMKTPTGSPKKDRGSARIPSKVISSSLEFSTVKTPTGSPKKDRGFARIPSKMISSSSEFSKVKTTTGSPEKDHESPRNPVAPNLVSKRSKKGSTKDGRNEIQSASFKPEAAAVNGDDTENSLRVDLPSETTSGAEVLNKQKPTLPSHQQLIHFVPHPSLRDLPATKLSRNWRRRCAALTTRKLPVCKSRSLRIPSER